MRAAITVLGQSRTLRRAFLVGAAATAALFLFAAPAFAHIGVTPGTVPAGQSAVLTFHVPDEEAHADTVRVDMQIPTDHPIAQLLVQPVPGWTISVRTVTLSKPVVTNDGKFTQAVSEVIWSGGRILPGQFQDFSVSADPLPTGVRQLAFKTIQTYSNGDVVSWIDLRQPGRAEPAHPAPVLTLTTATTPAASTRATVPGAGSDGTARALAIAALVAGLLALAAALRHRQLPAPASGAGAPALNGNGASSLPVQTVGLTEPKPASAKAGPRPPGAKGAGSQARPRRRK